MIDSLKSLQIDIFLTISLDESNARTRFNHPNRIFFLYPNKQRAANPQNPARAQEYLKIMQIGIDKSSRLLQCPSALAAEKASSTRALPRPEPRINTRDKRSRRGSTINIPRARARAGSLARAAADLAGRASFFGRARNSLRARRCCGTQYTYRRARGALWKRESARGRHYAREWKSRFI